MFLGVSGREFGWSGGFPFVRITCLTDAHFESPRLIKLFSGSGLHATSGWEQSTGAVGFCQFLLKGTVYDIAHSLLFSVS